MSMRIVPSASHPTSTTQSSQKGAPSAPGVHDTLRSNLKLSAPVPSSSSSTSQQDQAASQIQSTHPLETRLAQWRNTQDALKMNMLGQQFGMAEPVRRGMELHIAREGEWMPSLVRSAGGGLGSSVSGDILTGRDCELGWEDVFNGTELRGAPDFHTEMEAKMRMNW